MISVDRRTGSRELAPLIAQHDIPTQITTLEFGDFAFTGNGPAASRVTVGIERKRIDTSTDFLDSMRQGRLAGHQLKGLAELYDYCYLVLEGSWREGANKQLEINEYGAWRPVSMLWTAIENYVTTLELHSGIIYRQSFSAQTTARLVGNLYSYWNSKLWDEHTSHLTLYAPGPVHKPVFHRNMFLQRRDDTYLEKVAFQLPGIGCTIDKSSKTSLVQRVDQAFGTIRRMAEASVKQWREIDGIGQIGAKRLFRIINDGK